MAQFDRDAVTIDPAVAGTQRELALVEAHIEHVRATVKALGSQLGEVEFREAIATIERGLDGIDEQLTAAAERAS